MCVLPLVSSVRGDVAPVWLVPSSSPRGKIPAGKIPNDSTTQSGDPHTLSVALI